MNTIIIETIILGLLFTIMVYKMSRNPIKELYNYPPKIQERVKSLEQYKNDIPTQKKKISVKLVASLIIIIVISLIMKYINGYNSFLDGFKYSLIIWSIINWYDAIILDCLWFCHSKQFIIQGTEDMVDEYHNYWFHIKGSTIGEIIGLFVCLIVGVIVTLL
jgi:hypothetical protein